MRTGDNRTLRTGLEGWFKTSTESAHLLDARGQLLQKVVHGAVLANQARDLRGGVDAGRMVAPAELLADLRQRGVCELAREVHRDLARIDDVLRALVADELLEGHVEALDDEILDALDRHGGDLALWEDIFEHVLRELDRHRPAGQRREGDDA